MSLELTDGWEAGSDLVAGFDWTAAVVVAVSASAALASAALASVLPVSVRGALRSFWSWSAALWKARSRAAWRRQMVSSLGLKSHWLTWASQQASISSKRVRLNRATAICSTRAASVKLRGWYWASNSSRN